MNETVWLCVATLRTPDGTVADVPLGFGDNGLQAARRAVRTLRRRKIKGTVLTWWLLKFRNGTPAGEMVEIEMEVKT